MTNYQENVGKFIISSELGIGEISEVVSMGDKGAFYKASFKKSQATNFFSVENQSNYRFLETKENLEKAIAIFNDDSISLKFGSIKEKIQTIKKDLKSTDIENLAKILSWLNNKEEVHTSLIKLFKSSLSSFVQEIEFVFNIKNIEAWKLLGLNKNNN